MDNKIIKCCANAVRSAIEADCDDKGIALACIKAMREPTEKMLEDVYKLRATADDFFHKSVYQAMIDAIINE